MKTVGMVSTATAMLLLLGSAATAHHSAVQFDFTKTVAITGVVKKFEAINPHMRLILHVKDAKGERDIEFEGHSTNNMYRAGYRHQIPTVIVVKGNLDSYFSPRDRHVIYIDASLAARGVMYALDSLGLASSVINWPDFEPLEAKMAKTLRLAPQERVIMLIAVGYADPEGIIPFSEKKSLDVLRRFNPLPPA